VFDYLADEVFQQQPAHVRSFLLQTAILGRLCGPLCAAVTGQQNAHTLLDDLDQANLFLIRLDSNRHWYRYHHLFQDFLRGHLEREVQASDRALRAHISASASSAWLLPYVARLLEAFPPKASERPSPVPSPTLLSERELAVLQLIAEGRSVREIATGLVISTHTARTHLKNIYTKLDAQSRPGA
jgi:ATP/maltotriose-dependent transcriptional regulator MalT